MDHEIVDASAAALPTPENYERLSEQFKHAQVGRCVNSVTHDVNNLLGAIMAYSELLSFDPGISEDGKTMAANIIT